MLRIITNLAIVGAALPLAEALLVAPGSPCSDRCGNVQDSTSVSDIVCGQDQYSTGYDDGTGQVFQGCIQCQLQSTYATSSNYTDAMAVLYNLRYTVSSCVFDYPKNPHFKDSPCVINKSCGAFVNATSYQNLSTKYNDFAYCNEWPVDDDVDFQGCVECLQIEGSDYLANYVTVLQAGCEQKPKPGMIIGLQGNVFSNTLVNISASTSTAQVDPAWFDQGPLTLNAKVGIAVGCFVFLLIIAGIAIIWNGKRRRRAFLKTLEANYANGKGTNGGWPSPGPLQRDMGETPVSQRPLRGWDDSPMTINTEKAFPRYFSPYSSQFNSPVSAQDTHQMPWPETALASPREIGLTLSAVGDTNNNDRWPTSPEDKGKMKEESYEMHNVDSAGSGGHHTHMMGLVHVEAPILGHPGYGRSTDSPPRQYDATERDAINGD